MRLAVAGIAAAVMYMSAGLVSAEADGLELVMVERPGCIWCARWNEEIAPAYPNTEEGRDAPLRRVQLSDMPAGLDLERAVIFTPTFLLVRGNEELARIEGYPGDHFFWGLLGRMIEESGK